MNDRILDIRWRYEPWDTGQLERYAKVLGRPVKMDEKGSHPSWEDGSAEISVSDAAFIDHPFYVKKVKPWVKPGPIESFEPRPSSPAPVNDKCHVIVAGTSVMEIKHVKVERDYCTDALQGDLNKGWRILAICVQPDQRRPDYVLGRVDNDI